MMENSPMALSDSRVSRRWWMLVTVKSLSLVARITGNWKSLLVAKGVAFHETLWIFAGCRPILGRQMSLFVAGPRQLSRTAERMFMYYIEREVICQEKYRK